MRRMRPNRSARTILPHLPSFETNGPTGQTIIPMILGIRYLHFLSPQTDTGKNIKIKLETTHVKNYEKKTGLKATNISQNPT